MKRYNTKKGVDIIIPIYNAYEDLVKCLESLYKYTDFEKNRLILINDNSPDERIKAFLEEQRQRGAIVFHNDSNKGFSNNVNIGIEQSTVNDVILLNSDTVVTERWVEKIVECAYSNEVIGTVTPLSNNATLCSVPFFCEENKLPENMTIDQVADIVEKCSLEKYPRITVANGFCMLIKREVINAIGKFDAETFGRGYGEENDFCNRAEQLGYIHVMCDNTYIYHSGSKSFISDEKAAFIAKHEKILNERYPEQMYRNACYCRDNPNGWIGYNVEFHLDINNGKKNILYVLQSDFESGSNDCIGGTQIHVKHLVNGLKNSENLFIAARDGDYLKVSIYANNKRHIFKFWIGESEGYPVIRNPEIAKVFANILEGFSIDLVHVHHTISTSLDIFDEAKKRKIPTIYSIHDFYSVCPNQILTNKNGEVCIEKENLPCEECLYYSRGVYDSVRFLERWRAEYRKKLSFCKLIVAPSKSARKVISQYYPEITEKIVVIEHGIDKVLIDKNLEQVEQTDHLMWKLIMFNKDSRCYFIAIEINSDVEQEKIIFRATDKFGVKKYFPSNFGANQFFVPNGNQFFGFVPSDGLARGKVTVDVIIKKGSKLYINEKIRYAFEYSPVIDKEKLKIAFLGGINKDKGSETITELIQNDHPHVEWYIFGGIGDQKLYNLKKKNLVKTSFYYAEDIGTFLRSHGIDLVCLLSKVPETFSYTLSEAVVNGIPVIATDIGALGERCALHEYGWTVSNSNTVNDVTNIIYNIMSNRRVLEEKKRLLEIMSVKSISQMIEEYSEQYNIVLSHYFEMFKYIERRKNMEFINKANLKSNFISAGNMISDELPDYTKLDREVREYRHLQTTLAYKLIVKFQKMQFPLKEVIRKKMMKHIR